MIILNQEGQTNTEKSLPPPPPGSKAEEAAKEREAEREQMTLRRGQSSRSYTEAPPPSYEAVEGETLESQLPSTSDSSFQFIRPSLSRSTPSFPEAQAPRLEAPNHEPPLPPIPRTLAQTTSHSDLRPYNDLSPNHSSVPSSRALSSYASAPALVPRSLDFFPNTSPSHGPLASTTEYGYSSTTLSTAPYSSTLSVNTISPEIPPATTPSPPSNTPPIQVPAFTPSAKKGFFSTQSGNKKRNAKEARQFVLSQITHLLQNQTTPEYNIDAYKSILKSCAEACSSNKLYLPAILQEKNVEEHTPFYWSIVQRASSTSPQMPDLLQALLVFGAPLTEDTRVEVGRACLMVNDPKLYQALRVNRYFMALGTAEGAISSYPVFKDRVVVEDKGGGVNGGNGEFAATLEIPRCKERAIIQVEFIAQRRLWRLTIRKTSNVRKWKIGIGLLEQSSSTYVDSRFILQSLTAPLSPSRTNSVLSTSLPPSPTRTYSDFSDTASISAASVSTASGSGSGSSSSRSTIAPPTYGYGVPSAFVAAAYSGYPPEKVDMAQHQKPPQRPMSMASVRTDSGSSVNALSFYPDVVKATTGASLRNREESFSSLPSDSGHDRHPGMSRMSSSGGPDENGVHNTALNGSGSRSGSVGDVKDGEDEEFSVSAPELLPLPGDPVMKEVRLKSNSMISAGKKEIESEMEIEIDLIEDGGEKTMRARFEARLAKPESDCVIC